MRRSNLPRKYTGYTLVELVITMALLGILSVVGSSMLSDSFSTTYRVNESNASKAEARYVLERLAREIREAKYLEAGSYCIEQIGGVATMTATRLVFDKRNNSHSLDRQSCNTDSNRVTVNYSAPNLTLAYATPALSATLSSRVAPAGFTLRYLGSDASTVASTGAAVRFVEISLTLTDATGAQGLPQRMRVALRNS
jgi:prepilin-type N-terminal cleavage/methylation domain-containing protein